MDKIFFTVNGDRYSLSGSEVSAWTSLNDYLREYLQLHGTKAMCHEGGCGACVVAVTRTHPLTKEKYTIAVNSCLVHVLSCHEWSVSTVEGVGGRARGYHPVQSRLAGFNGSQCGYCSPGMVMTMYSLSKGGGKVTMQQVEESLGGNLCRCTGYRPILDAFKSFATDLEPALRHKLQDVEDLHKIKCRTECRKPCSKEAVEEVVEYEEEVEEGWCLVQREEPRLRDVALAGAATRWYKAYTVQDVFKVLAREGTASYKLVAGNTGQGVFPPRAPPHTLVDISSVPALQGAHVDENLTVGAGTSLADLMTACHRWATRADFSYLARFHDHLAMVAHPSLRNIGTVGGNLALKNMHHGFPSDVFLLLATVGATVTLLNDTLKQMQVKMEQFLKESLKNIIIMDVKLPPLAETNILRTFKIMPRAQNAHAIVNAGFYFQLDKQKKVEFANIVYGNISPRFTSAKQTAAALQGLQLFDDKTLQRALLTLNQELVPEEDPPEPSPACRKAIALGLFYKAVLSACPAVSPRYASGGGPLARAVSRGQQTFDTDKSLWPLNKPVPKLEALTQCSGEVKYVCDVTTDPRAVQVAFILSEISKGEIEQFDASEALKVPGVIAFFTAEDIPGKNSFTPNEVPWQEGVEEILATRILYYGQPIALVAATNKRLALTAAGLVKVKYKKSEDKPVLTIREALKAPDKDIRVRQEYKVEPTDKGTDVSKVLVGSYSMPSQYHFHMETQSCTVSNTSRGVRVRSATQWMDLVNVAVGDALGIDHNRVEVVVPRLGGAYGGKASRAALVACACAVVAYSLQRTATLVMPLQDNMLAIGKRSQCDFDYEVGINSEGQIQYLKLRSYSDAGCTFSDSLGDLSRPLSTLYDTARWNMEGYSVLTDKASNTWCRAPGNTEAVAVVEHMMERIAAAAGRDAAAVRMMHFSEENAPMKEIVTSFRRDCDFDQRSADIDKYNAENAWKKKAIKWSVMAYPIEYSWNFPVSMSVYHADGTVAVSHGGVEMGQGVNTKLAQVCAYTLSIPLEKVQVLASNSFTSPNAMASNGSITSDSLALAAVQACRRLLARLRPVRDALHNPSWEELVQAAFNKGVNLQTSYMTSPADGLQEYTVYGACVAEVELDVLTGRHELRRLDLLEDTGVSLSPDIDVGQIEGAFVMGVGLWTSERLQYAESGRLLTSRTWNYHPPGARDIPQDFRVSFRRNAPNPAGVLRSKATGEPALVLAVAVPFALHYAVLEARKEFGYCDTDWVFIDTPYSVESLMKAIAPKYQYYKLQ